MTPGFREIADRIHVLRHPVLDVNVTLVVGEGAALVVDTLSTGVQGRELVTAVRRITPAPLTVVNTHHHFDHCFGNHAVVSAGAAVAVWAHEAAVALLRERAETQRRHWRAAWAGDPVLAAGLDAVVVRPPDRTVRVAATLDLGGRTVELRHPGPGHTAGDLVVAVPDAAVVVAGDLVEEGAPPQFDDGYPVQWPDAVAALLDLVPPDGLVVPGHGAVVDTGFVRAQHAGLAALAWLIREGHADGAPVEAVAARAPFDPATSTVAVRRGYAELDGA